MSSDYIFPSVVTKILKRPSERTLMETSLIGITLIMIGGFGIVLYFVFFTDMSIWFKILISFSGIGIFLFQFSALATTYVQYHIFKKTMGLYPEDYKLQMKVSEAKELVNELNKLIKNEH